MELFVKEMKGKRTTYRQYVPPDNSMHEIEASQLITILTTLTVSMLMSVERQLPPHRRAAREIKAVEGAVIRLAKLNAAPLEEHLLHVGVVAWNAMVKSIQDGLSGGEA